MLVEAIILKCSLKIQGERTNSSIYHLLNGKKSIQTVLDVHMYQLGSFYGVHRSLTKKAFEKKISELISLGLLQRKVSTESFYKPSTVGVNWLDKNKPLIPFSYYNGLKYYETANVFFERLTLLIQTLTNSKMNYYKFIPVIDNTSIENWVKSLYHKTKSQESKLLSKIYSELDILLHYFSDQEAEIFVDRLTGYNNYGMSIHQLAAKYRMTSEDIQLLFTGMIHRMLTIIDNTKSGFPFMSYILKDISSNSFITNSASTTYKLLKKGYSIETIALQRQLKTSTIYDHIVEIALYDTDFPINNYVSEDKQQKIINAFNFTKSYKLKKIKQLVDQDISYFQIRVVLASAKNLIEGD